MASGAAEALESGADFDTVAAAARDREARGNFFVIVPTLEVLIRGGRLREGPIAQALG